MIEVLIYLAGLLMTFPIAARWLYRTERPADPVSPPGAVAFGLLAGVLWPGIVLAALLFGLCKALGPLVTWRNG